MDQLTALAKSLSFDRMQQRANEEVEIANFAFFDNMMRTNGIVVHKRSDKSWGERLRNALDSERIKPRSKGDWAMPTRKSPKTRAGRMAMNVDPHRIASSERIDSTVFVNVNGKRKRVPKRHAPSKPLGFTEAQLRSGRIVQVEDISN